MNALILELLAQIEMSKGIKILFAVEAGSRCWGIESEDSDYDVRFVFARQPKEYARIGKMADVIEHIEGNIDLVGFDVLKYARLLISSNPSAIEWLFSPITYLDREIFRARMRAFIKGAFNPLALYHHYRSMCKQNYLKYLKSRQCLTAKKYLYAMRGLVNAEWVSLFKSIPPIDFNSAYLDVVSYSVKTKLLLILQAKRAGKEQDVGGIIPEFDEEIESFLKNAKEVESRKLGDYSVLQEMVWEAIDI